MKLPNLLGSITPPYENLFLKSCRCEPTPRTPLWLMRQAGRYMKSYRALRERYSFKDLCQTPDLAAQITVEAAQKLGVDAAIIFSDILLLLEPMGFNLSYEEGRGPVVSPRFRDGESLTRLKAVSVQESMGFLMEAIRGTRRELKPEMPLIGFAGGPFTMAAYVIEGGKSKQFKRTRDFLTKENTLSRKLFEFISKATIDLLNAQIEAGVQAVQIFDSWAGNLSGENYRKYVLPYARMIIGGIKKGVPVIHFGLGTGKFLDTFSEAGGNVIGVDGQIPLDEAWTMIGSRAIQGNLDPLVLLKSKSSIRKEAKKILDQAGGRLGHIFNLGHGVLPQTPEENVRYLVDVVKEMSQKGTVIPVKAGMTTDLVAAGLRYD
ncbi:MAG: uroporphyrinogen decarboxylase [Elusimicrobia bacterium]|nr:uroporphyrinogen decarboxylase [Candidatus Obscuribacterium magneticum]